MSLRWLPVLTIVLLAEYGLSTIGSAQTGPGQLQPPAQPQTQSPITISPIQPSSAPTSGLPANILTPSTTNQLEPSTGPRVNRGGAFSSAGRGLPGLSGGAPLNSPMGAQDPTADYMRPPAVGPLFCDPGINIPC